MKKHTAIDFILDNLISEPHTEEDFNHNSLIWDLGKIVEKSHIINAYEAAEKDCGKDFLHGDLYYSETFKNTKNEDR